MQQSQQTNRRAVPRVLSVPVLVPIRPSGSRLPLFCVTAGYGDMLALANLARQLGSEQPVLGLQPPSSARAQPVTPANLNTLVGHYIDAMRSRHRHGPFLLAGYCSGGLVAFEVARQLQAQGDAVAMLILLDTPYGISTTSYLLYQALRSVADRLLPKLTRSSSRAMQMLHASFKDQGLAQHMRLLAGYRPTPYVGPIVLFLAHYSFTRLVPTVTRWTRVIRGPLDIRVVPGTHESFLRSPNVAMLAEQMERMLAQVERAHTL